MDRALVVLDETEHGEELLAEAGKLAGGVDAELVILSFLEQEEFEHDAEVLSTIADSEQSPNIQDSMIDPITGEELAEEEAEGLAHTILQDIDVEYQVTGKLIEDIEDEEMAQMVIDTAERSECDHIFLTGAKRSPVGKAIFGDMAQQVILNSGGMVTLKQQG